MTLLCVSDNLETGVGGVRRKNKTKGEPSLKLGERGIGGSAVARS